MEQQMQQMQTDHDLLIQLNVNVQTMRDEMRQNTQQVSGQVTDHETRLRVLEQNSNSMQGASTGRKDMSGTVKWVIGTLIAFVAVGIATISVLVAQK